MLTQDYCDHLYVELLSMAAELRNCADELCASYEATSGADDTQKLWNSSTFALDAFSHEKTAEIFSLWPTLSVDGKKDILFRHRQVLLEKYIPTLESDVFLIEQPIRFAA